LQTRKPYRCGFFQKAAQAAEGFMFTLTSLINILVVDIILVLVLVILVQKENSVFGHAKVSRGITAAK
jgi:hypothetical protein